MTTDIDILYINNKILQNFNSEKMKLEDYKEKLQEIRKSLELNHLRPQMKETLTETEKHLNDYINDLEIEKSKNFYIIDSAVLIEKYKEILQKPEKISFSGRINKKNKEKENIINQFIELASKYVDIDINIEKKEKEICKNCKCKDFEIEDGDIYICTNCHAQQYVMKNVTSYKDIDRVNVSSKYVYDRKIHFRDSLNQYQGKQNVTVNNKVYQDLEKQFDLHHLLNGNKNTPKNERFKNITKEHISIFLKELDYSKHYENINLIHYNLTGIKPDDIGYLEDKLLEDFDTLTALYDKMFKNNIDRKNFINTQFVLHKLLLKHKHPCKKEDFSILKTVDRLNFHNDVCRELFNALNWSWQS